MNDETQSQLTAEDKAAAARERMAKARAARKPKQDATPAAVASKPTASADTTADEAWDVVEIGIEKTALGNDLGPFEPPAEFDKKLWCVGWACPRAGEVENFPSISQLSTPERHPEVGMVRPGYRIWLDSEGNQYSIQNGKLVLMYLPRAAQDKINVAYSKLAKTRMDNRIIAAKRSLHPLPDDIRRADEQTEERMMSEINQLTAMHAA
jgi:hypothetical protein